MTKPKHHYPNESPEYRRARDELLAAELEARRAVERAAALRRELPPGGALPENYVFEVAGGDDTAGRVPLSGLFGEGRTTLLLYSYMFGPDMESPARPARRSWTAWTGPCRTSPSGPASPPW